MISNKVLNTVSILLKKFITLALNKVESFQFFHPKKKCSAVYLNIFI